MQRLSIEWSKPPTYLFSNQPFQRARATKSTGSAVVRRRARLHVPQFSCATGRCRPCSAPTRRCRRFGEGVFTEVRRGPQVLFSASWRFFWDATESGPNLGVGARTATKTRCCGQQDCAAKGGFSGGGGQSDGLPVCQAAEIVGIRPLRPPRGGAWESPAVSEAQELPSDRPSARPARSWT